MRRFCAPAALTVALALPGAATAASNPARSSAPSRTSAGPILSASDANDLAQNLNDATSVQGICYGWTVMVDDSSGGPSGTDAGSSKDPSNDAARDCKKWVTFTASIDYVSDSSESNDSLSWNIDSSPPSLANSITRTDLVNVGASPANLLDDDNDTALINLMQALPLIVADKGEAKPVPAELTPKPASSPDHPTNQPGADWIRENLALFIISLVVIGLGIIWGIHNLLGLRRDRRHYQHGRELHAHLADHVPEGKPHSPPPKDDKPHAVVQTWVTHLEQSGAELTPERKAQLLQTIESAKENGSLALSSSQLKRIRKQLAPAGQAKPSAEAEAEAEAQASEPATAATATKPQAAPEPEQSASPQPEPEQPQPPPEQ